MSGGFWQWLEARSDRKDARRLLLIEQGLDCRTLARRMIESADPKLFVAFAIIGLFAWAFAENPTDETFVGALIAAFAGAWGYYLGSSNTASRANDRADRSVEIAHEAMKALPKPDPKPDLELEPGETATVAAEGDR